MHTLRRSLLGLLVPALAAAQVQVQVNVALPTITFATPPALVVVQPGVQVVEDFDDEVYFVEGFYWVRREGRWFRTKTHRGGWVVVDRGVPGVLVAMPPGQYRKWKGKPGKGRDDDDGRGRGKGKGKKDRD